MTVLGATSTERSGVGGSNDWHVVVEVVPVPLVQGDIFLTETDILPAQSCFEASDSESDGSASMTGGRPIE